MSDYSTLTAIIPVYNEPDWIPISITDLDREIASSPFAGQAEILIVDDGSDVPVSEVLAGLDIGTPVRVVRLDENEGRWEARRRALPEATGDLLLFIDSRVSLAPGSLTFIHEQTRSPAHLVWNGHVDMDDAVNPYSRFWKILVEEAWRDFWAGDGRVRFGPEEFDRYPRGFGCFVAPADDMRWAYKTAATSFFTDARRMNDEMVLRRLVDRHFFNLDPAFKITYRGRRSLKAFVRHAHHRGVFFIDGFLRPGTRFFIPLLAFVPGSIAGAAWLVRRPRRITLLGAIPILAAVMSRLRGRDARDTRILATLSLPWAAAFVAGLWRGLALATFEFLRSHEADRPVPAVAEPGPDGPRSVS